MNKINSIPPKGLENVGATCYMNAVLQCFYHVKPLTSEIITYNSTYNLNQNMLQQYPMTIAYLDVVKQLSFDKSRAGKPILFKNVISMNPLFTGVQANDSKDLILYFLEKIDYELTMHNFISQNKTLYNVIRDYQSMQVFHKNPELQQIINVFVTNHKSIFSDLFYGFMKQIIECSQCHFEFINYQIFNFIIFPIENVYNSKKNKDNNYNSPRTQVVNKASMPPAGKPSYTSNSTYGSWYGQQNTNISLSRSYNYGAYDNKRSVTLEDCFQNEIEYVNFKGENQIYCNRCKKLLDAKGKNKIFSTPHVLILILNRGKANQFDCDVEFQENLNISRYVEIEQCPKNFKLIGVISHFGESGMGGHFIADCKHFDGKWYCFNDGLVTGPNYKYSKQGIPYILFYQNADYN